VAKKKIPAELLDRYAVDFYGYGYSDLSDYHRSQVRGTIWAHAAEEGLE
jgi:hypothetical protein